VRDATNWKAIGGPAGSNPGGLYADDCDRRWYVKTPPSDDHARSELLANRLYRLAGTRVADVELVRRDGGLAVASAFLRGATLGEVLSFPDSGAAAEVCRDFAVDAWLGNRDVLGADLDNLLFTGTGAIVRIDQGGALHYRARGARKTDFGASVIEFESLRDPRSNGVAASVFGAMTPHALAASVAKVAKIDAAAIGETVTLVHGDTAAAHELIALLIARRDDLVRRIAESEPAAGARPALIRLRETEQ
jgi:hypothetical protein